MTRKLKTHKARLELIPPEALYGMAEAFEDGANKRSAFNWELGESSKTWSKSDRISAIMRHSLQLQMGNELAEDSMLHHAAHILANAAMLYTAYIRGDIGLDDVVRGKE